MLKDLLVGYPVSAAVGISLAVAVAIAYLVAEAVARLVRLAFLRLLRRDADASLTLPIVRRPIRAIRLAVFGMTLLVLLFPALKVAGFHVQVGVEPEELVAWLLQSGVRIGAIALFAALVIRAISTAVARLVQEASVGDTIDALERAKRVRTLGTLIENIVAVVVVGAAVLMVLRELKVDIMPLLTGAGIVGLAVGFGAQTLVKDIISGFFMIFENQVRVGDVVEINGRGGAVESIQLRTITLRDVEGAVHVFPNGSITTLTNKTKDFSYAVLDLSVAYKEDTDRVTLVLRDVGAELQADPTFAPNILAPLEVFGIDAFGESAVTIKIRVKTLPLKQWDVARELRRRVKKAFDAHGVEIPFPQRVLQVVRADQNDPKG